MSFQQLAERVRAQVDWYDIIEPRDFNRLIEAAEVMREALEEISKMSEPCPLGLGTIVTRERIMADIALAKADEICQMERK